MTQTTKHVLSLLVIIGVVYAVFMVIDPIPTQATPTAVAASPQAISIPATHGGQKMIDGPDFDPTFLGGQAFIYEEYSISDKTQLVYQVPSGVNCAVNPNFPPEVMQWCNLITYYSRENSLDPDLVASLVWQESKGNPDAQSFQCAFGLGQVMPIDGSGDFINGVFRCNAGSNTIAAYERNFNTCPLGFCFQKRPTKAWLKVPKNNVSYFTRMLRGNINYWGSVKEGLRHYGPYEKATPYRYVNIIFSHYKTYTGRTFAE